MVGPQKPNLRSKSVAEIVHSTGQHLSPKYSRERLHTRARSCDGQELFNVHGTGPHTRLRYLKSHCFQEGLVSQLRRRVSSRTCLAFGFD